MTDIFENWRIIGKCIIIALVISNRAVWVEIDIESEKYFAGRNNKVAIERSRGRELSWFATLPVPDRSAIHVRAKILRLWKRRIAKQPLFDSAWSSLIDHFHGAVARTYHCHANIVSKIRRPRRVSRVTEKKKQKRRRRDNLHRCAAYKGFVAEEKLGNEQLIRTGFLPGNHSRSLGLFSDLSCSPEQIYNCNGPSN